MSVTADLLPAILMAVLPVAPVPLYSNRLLHSGGPTFLFTESLDIHLAGQYSYLSGLK